MGDSVEAGRALRVLVVDDDEDGADVLALALTERGYDTRTASDAPSALRVATEFSPEVAVLDLGLPVVDGYELAARLRGMPEMAGLRLIALSGYGDVEDRRRSAAAGFDQHLVKPTELSVLEAALRVSTR